MKLRLPRWAKALVGHEDVEYTDEPEADAVTEVIRTNRAMRRSMANARKLRGPGWTRPMRAGRRQREER